MRSIRTNLVLWLIGASAAVTVAVLAATYLLAQRQLGRVLDAELRQIAQAVHLRENWAEEGTIRVARDNFLFTVRAYDERGRVFFETLLPSHPFDAPRTQRAGFSNVDAAGADWRVYTHITPEGVVQVAQPESLRNALARDLSLRMSLPVLLLMPLLALLTAWVLGRGLAPIALTSRRVSDRDAARLDPLPIDGVPQELAPLVEQINGLLRRLSDSLDGQRRFFADAAHELRSPVAALALQAQIAARAQAPAERAAAHRELAQGIERAGRLVQQLLDLARLEPGVRGEAPAQLDVARLAREVVGSHAAQAESQGVDLGADAPRAAMVTGAPTEIRSLIANLVDNSLRYAPGGSDVTVAVRALGGAVEIEVADTGPGIPPEERGRVLERFQRAAGDATSGTGLGLPIAKAVAERHGGSISLADAHPGRHPPGLSVRVVLAADGGPASAGAHAGESTAA